MCFVNFLVQATSMSVKTVVTTTDDTGTLVVAAEAGAEVSRSIFHKFFVLFLLLLLLMIMMTYLPRGVINLLTHNHLCFVN